jgi:hypothetical protein
VADKPACYGAYIFLGLPKNDFIIKRKLFYEQVIDLIPKPIPETVKPRTLSDIVKKFSPDQLIDRRSLTPSGNQSSFFF